MVGTAERPEPERLALLARMYVQGLEAAPDFRSSTVTFCCREALEPIWLLEYFLEEQASWTSRLDPQLLLAVPEDWPLRYICLGWRLFWS